MPRLTGLPPPLGFDRSSARSRRGGPFIRAALDVISATGSLSLRGTMPAPLRTGRALLAAIAGGTTLLCTLGCLPAKREAYRSSAPIGVAFDSPESDRLWNAAREVLRDHRFTLDRVDRRRGVITTMPETSQGIGEFWRSDVATREDLWESTLNAIRRKATIRFVGPASDDLAATGSDSAGTRELPAGGDARQWTSIEVVVRKERFASKERQFTSTGAVYQVFGSQLPSITGEPITEADDRWVDHGRDPAMEERLVEEILGVAGLSRCAKDSPADAEG